MLLFCTNNPSIQEHWQDACEGEKSLHVKDEQTLFATLKEYSDAIILLHIAFFSSCSLKDGVGRIRSSYPQAKAIIFSDTPTLEEAKPLLLESIYGYANARLAAVHLAQVLAVARAGSVWLPPELLQQMIQQIPTPAAQPQELDTLLSPRELELAQYVAKGYTNKQIAKATFITEHTVKVHLRSIFEKLDIHDRLSLALKFRNL